MRKTPRRPTATGSLSIAAHRRALLGVLQRDLIPWARLGGRDILVLGQPPLEPGISRHAPNPARKRAPELASGMKALRFPRLAFVYEGEADMRLGIMPASRRGTQNNPALPFQIASLSARQAIVFPAGVPLDTASFPHWFRPQPERAASRIFWIVLLPDGMLVHTCTTRGGTHERSAELFIKNTRLLLLAEQLIEELRTKPYHYELITQNCLVTMLTLVERALLHERVFFSLTESALSDSEAAPQHATDAAAHSVYRRACSYIEAHVHEPLTPAVIAHQVGVSPPHLNRLFRAAGSASVMRHVTAHRMQTARQLLRETELPVNEIASIVGISNHAIFHRCFKRATLLAPLAYRKQARLTA